MTAYAVRNAYGDYWSAYWDSDPERIRFYTKLSIAKGVKARASKQSQSPVEIVEFSLFEIGTH